jgi:hypothetical protein
MTDAAADLPALRMHATVLDSAELEPMVAFWSAALGYVRWFEPFGQYAGLRWTVMADPAGNEFCITER